MLPSKGQAAIIETRSTGECTFTWHLQCVEWSHHSSYYHHWALYHEQLCESHSPVGRGTIQFVQGTFRGRGYRGEWSGIEAGVRNIVWLEFCVGEKWKWRKYWIGHSCEKFAKGRRMLFGRRMLLSILILLFTPLLRNAISKFHSPFSPYKTPLILFNLLPNLGIQTGSSIAQLIHLPSM